MSASLSCLSPLSFLAGGGSSGDDDLLFLSSHSSVDEELEQLLLSSLPAFSFFACSHESVSTGIGSLVVTRGDAFRAALHVVAGEVERALATGELEGDVLEVDAIGTARRGDTRVIDATPLADVAAV